MGKFKIVLSVGFISLFSLFLMLPLFHTGFFSFHDNAQVQRVYELTKALLDGMFPVRWSVDLGYGYGYPIFNFYAPFLYYLAALFAISGVSLIVATKIVIGIGIFLSGIGMFLLGRKIFSPLAGVLAAVSYMYAPYHALDIYVRGDLAEAFAYSLIPWLFYVLIQMFFSPFSRKRWAFAGAVLYAVLILSHNLTALMVTPFLFVTACVLVLLQKEDKKKQIFLCALFFLCGILLSAFYWLPTFVEMKLTNVTSITTGGSDFHQHFVCLNQLWDSPWGFGGSAPGCTDGISFKIGKLAVILSAMAIVSFFLFFVTKKQKITPLQHVIFFGSIAGLGVSLFLLLSISQFFWEALPFMAYFQFPWRFLIMTVFFTSLLSGGFFWMVSRFVQTRGGWYVFISPVLCFGCILIIFFTDGRLFSPQHYTFGTDADYTTKQNLIWETSKISDEYLPAIIRRPANEQEALRYHPVTTSNVAFVKSLQQTTTTFQAVVLTPTAQRILLHIAPFPAWHVSVDEKEVVLTPSSEGIQFFLPPGLHKIRAVFLQTPVEQAADEVSFAGVLILFIGILISI